MRIIVDTEMCGMHGDCVIEAPELFDLGEQDWVTVLHEVPAASQLEAAKRAVAACPVSAIRLVD